MGLAAFAAFRASLASPLSLPQVLECALWCVVVVALLGWLDELRRLSGEQRWSAFGPLTSLLLVIHAWSSFRLDGWLGDETAAETGSRIVASLSSTWHGWPFVALAYAWGSLALAASAAGLVQRGLTKWSGGAETGRPSWAGAVLLVWTAGFGSLAVLGYATGSPWLWPE
jgi:UDP-N-acetylmuramyl pentapeptide phosphotransferase/UDP-N-acetylglucosamine-1-phosphate transferase